MEHTSRRRYLSRGLVGGTIAVGLMLGASTLAGADPKSGPFTLACEDGTETQVVSNNGNGDWTPAFDPASNTRYIPVEFGEFHGTVLDADGNIVDEFSEEGAVKGRSAKRKGDLVDCTFSFVEVSDGSDPEFPEGYTFIGGGDVSVMRTPRR